MSDPLDFTRQDTVLIIDDTPESLTVMSGVLRGHYKTKVANSGARGLDVIAADQPDLVLLDIEMPDMDGYEVCRRLKADPATAAIPVIFLTAKTAVEDEQRGFDVGCVDYITKPISVPIVLSRVKTHLLLKGAQDFMRDKNAYLEAEVARRTGEIALAHERGRARTSARIASVRALGANLRLAAHNIRSHPKLDPGIADALDEIEKGFTAIAALLIE